MNQDGYIENLEKNLIPFADKIYDNTNEWIFLQDNAPIHRGKKTMLWLEESQVKLVKHPPYSPDLNSIEFIWKLLKDSVEKQNPENLSDLKNSIINTWNNIAQESINGSINYCRIIEIFNSDGDFV